MSEDNLAKPEDLALLVGKSHQSFIVRLTPGAQLQTHRGVLNHDDLVGKPWGSQVFSHKGNPFFLMQPALGDLLLQTRRTTQIMYPKDIGFILVTMGIGPGVQVVEAGTGSGALTTALAFAVGPAGHITTYEVRPEMMRLAQKNIAKLGFEERVTFKLRDIVEGFDEQNADILFMDVLNPEDFIPQIRSALKPGGRFGCILPTMNQVARVIPALSRQDFAFIEVCEILMRYYKPVADRLRPTDRMVAHTGYLLFARPILPSEEVPSAGELSAAGENAFEESQVESIEEKS